MTPKTKPYRIDHGKAKQAYQKNRRTVLAQAEVCALCGLPIDKSLRFPDPMSATVDHIVPISKGGHPSDPQNLQPAHLICNQMKAAKETIEANTKEKGKKQEIGNRALPKSFDWLNYV